MTLISNKTVGKTWQIINGGAISTSTLQRQSATTDVHSVSRREGRETQVIRQRRAVEHYKEQRQQTNIQYAKEGKWRETDKNRCSKIDKQAFMNKITAQEREAQNKVHTSSSAVLCNQA